MNEPKMAVTCRQFAGRDVAEVVVEGPLVWTAARRLRRFLVDVIEDGSRHLVIDLGAVTDVDTAGLAALVIAARQLRCLGGSIRFGAVASCCATLMRESHLFTEQLTGKPPTGEPRLRVVSP